MVMNRFQAFGRHLAASLAVAAVCSVLVFLVWYRWPFPIATGVTKIFVLLLAVDVLIGPFITLVVFNPAKKELKFDLAVVVILQVCALIYGLHAVYAARHVYLVFSADRFDLVYANDLDENKLNEVRDVRFRSVPRWGTETIGALMPDDAKTRSDVLLSAMAGGGDLPQLPKYYVPYAELRGRVQSHVRPLEYLKRFNKGRVSEIEDIAKEFGSIGGGVGYLPLRGKVKDLTVIVRSDSAEILSIKDLEPWNE